MKIDKGIFLLLCSLPIAQPSFASWHLTSEGQNFVTFSASENDPIEFFQINTSLDSLLIEIDVRSEVYPDAINTLRQSMLDHGMPTEAILEESPSSITFRISNQQFALTGHLVDSIYEIQPIEPEQIELTLRRQLRNKMPNLPVPIVTQEEGTLTQTGEEQANTQPSLQTYVAPASHLQRTHAIQGTNLH